MTILDHSNKTPFTIWQEAIQYAENQCAIALNQELETYLVTMLIRYSHKPEMVKQFFARSFLEALQANAHHRKTQLQAVGDQCLIFAGLFPAVAEKKLVKISYFVNIGQSAYAAMSNTTNDLFGSLAFEFVALMDVLQSIQPFPTLLPLEAYEQWQEVGSQRAFRILQEYRSKI